MDKVELYWEKAIEFIITNGPKFLLAVIVLIVGLWIIKKITKITRNVLNVRHIEDSLITFTSNMINVVLKTLLFLSVAGMLGIETTSFIAILGAAGLAIGLALQGALSNFAGGVLILLFKPYKVGDLIESQGKLGHVKEIQLFVTILLTFDKKTVILPNGAVANGDITNYTTEGNIRIDLVMGIAYEANIKDARKALLEVMEKHPKVLKDPAPFVGVLELADSSVNLAVRPHVKPEDYWDVYFDIYEQGKEALDASGVTIPFPQLDVHFDKDK